MLFHTLGVVLGHDDDDGDDDDDDDDIQGGYFKVRVSGLNLCLNKAESISLATVLSNGWRRNTWGSVGEGILYLRK